MINLTQKALPNTVTVGGRAFFIKTDYRVWIEFMNKAKSGKPFDCSFVFEDEHPATIAIEEIMTFAQPPRELPRRIEHNDAILLDFEQDADLIFAAFLQQYQIDLTEADLHWWKFLALLNGLSDSTTLSKVMSYRAYKKDDSKKDIYLTLKRAWEIIPPLTEEEQQELNDFESLFL